MNKKHWNVYYTFKSSTGRVLRKYSLVLAANEAEATEKAKKHIERLRRDVIEIEKPEPADMFYI